MTKAITSSIVAAAFVLAAIFLEKSLKSANKVGWKAAIPVE